MRKIKYLKDLKESIFLAQIAEEIKNIKRRYLINQIGSARPNTRSVSAQNEVLNTPVSSGTRTVRGNRGNQVNRGNRGNPVNTGNRANNVRGGTRGTRGTDWHRNSDRIGRDYEG
jgi:hypothetical protein